MGGKSWIALVFGIGILFQNCGGFSSRDFPTDSSEHNSEILASGTHPFCDGSEIGHTDPNEQGQVFGWIPNENGDGGVSCLVPPSGLISDEAKNGSIDQDRDKLDGDSEDSTNSKRLSQTLKSELETLRRESKNVPGLGASLRVENRTVALATSGVRKLGESTTVANTDSFQLGSCTKAMTATLFASLVEAGQVQWTSTLGDIFEEDFEVHDDFKQVTVEMLLAHQSGLSRGYHSSLWKELQRESDGQKGRLRVASVMLSMAPEHPPGSKFEYSNSGYTIVGAVIEKISGEFWENLMRKKIFNPLRMSSCGFGVPELDPNRITQPWGHSLVDGVLKPENPNDTNRRYSTTTWSAGGVHCNLSDWSKFLQAHLDGYKGINNIVTAASFEKLHTVYPGSATQYTYGGWYRTSRDWAGGPTLNHIGTNGSFYANVWLGLNSNIAVVAVTNARDSNENMSSVSDSAIGLLLNPKYQGR